MHNNNLPTYDPTLPPDAIILAAGKGVRMGSDLPKVLHPVAGQPMIHWVIKACLQAGVNRCTIVVGYRGDQVRQAVDNLDHCNFVDQDQQLGTAHAVQMAQPVFTAMAPRDVFVLAGDGPLIRPQTLSRLLDTHRTTNAAVTLATASLQDPKGYGRVIRSLDGSFQEIVEQKDATPEQLQIREINPSYYCFRSDLLFDALAKVSNTNAQGEFYLTDTPAVLKQDGHTVTLVEAVPPQDVLGVNNPQELAKADQILRSRVTPSTTFKKDSA